MKIRKLHLKNIGVFDNETIEFQPCPVKDKAEIHIFTGQNGSGKTTLLMALAYPFSSISLILGDGGQGLLKRAKDINKDILWIDFDDNGSFNLKDYGSYIAKFNKPIIDAKNTSQSNYAVFAFSGYRQISSEKVEANKELIEFNPLAQSLEFVKNYAQSSQLTVNQLVANNISNRALAKDEGNLKESERYERVIKEIEGFIKDIVGYEVKFILKRQPNELKLKINNEELDFDVLPDGLRSLISWIADLLGRVDLLNWQDDLPITEKNLILFLDEIEVHLHPAWQRKVLPVVQKLFKNSQIFVSTHSPFVVNSVDDAWVYKLKLENGKAKVAEVVRSEDGISYQTVLSEIFDIDEEFGGQTQEDLDKFYKIVRNGKKINKTELLSLAKSLAEQSDELNSIVQIELRQLSRRKGREFSL